MKDAFRVAINMTYLEGRPNTNEWCCDTPHRTKDKATRCGAETVRRMLPNSSYPASTPGPDTITTRVLNTAELFGDSGYTGSPAALRGTPVSKASTGPEDPRRAATAVDQGGTREQGREAAIETLRAQGKLDGGWHRAS